METSNTEPMNRDHIEVGRKRDKGMVFKRYNSIENSHRDKTIDHIREMGYDRGEWIATNKIHGANFSFFYDGDKLRVAKRSGFIGNSDGSFFRSDRIVERYDSKVRAVYEYLKMGHPSFKIMAIRGELFGGSYPHADVDVVDHASRVQKGVYYTPDNEFYMFDIELDNYPVSDYVLEAVAFKFGFEFWSKPMYRGTFDEMLALDPVFIDPMPEKIGLPVIPENYSEGFVLRPVEPKFFHSGSRCLLKHKNPSFSERSKRTPKVKKVIPDHIANLMREIGTFCTENRLRNVMSHYGPVGQKEFGRLNGEFVKDCIKDFLNEPGLKVRFLKLNKKEAKQVTKFCGSECAMIIRRNFLNIVDGNF